MITKYKIECVKNEPKDPELVDVRVLFLDEDDNIVKGGQFNIVGISATKEDIDYTVDSYFPSLEFVETSWEDIR